MFIYISEQKYFDFTKYFQQGQNIMGQSNKEPLFYLQKKNKTQQNSNCLGFSHSSGAGTNCLFNVALSYLLSPWGNTLTSLCSGLLAPSHFQNETNIETKFSVISPCMSDVTSLGVDIMDPASPTGPALLQHDLCHCA